MTEPVLPLYHTVQPVVLASGSPRRRELLASVGLVFDVLDSGVEESGGEGLSPKDLVEFWAREMARAVSRLRPSSWVLGADTVVALGGEIFGKPSGPDEAASMLERLSGRTHEVYTGVCLTREDRGIVHVESVCTEVLFKTLSPSEIAAYVRTGEPLDKAGAYGIQGFGAFLVRRIEGSYTNVVGLPLCEVLDRMAEAGIIAPL